MKKLFFIVANFFLLAPVMPIKTYADDLIDTSVFDSEQIDETNAIVSTLRAIIGDGTIGGTIVYILATGLMMLTVGLLALKWFNPDDNQQERGLVRFFKPLIPAILGTIIFLIKWNISDTTTTG